MVKYSAAQVAEALKAKVSELQTKGVLNDSVVYVVMMNGGVWFATHVFDCMPDMKNEVYFMKGHSYNGFIRERLIWDYFDIPNLEGRDVVVLDDICDTGNTSRAILKQLQHRKAESIRFFTLLSRTSTDTTGLVLDSCIVDDSDDFFYGCGLDSCGNADRFHPYIGVC